MSNQFVSHIDADMLIGGEWIDGESRIEVQNPWNGSVVGSIPAGTRKQFHKAIDSAEQAWRASDLSAYESYEFLSDAADALKADANAMARTITSEQGKPISKSRTEVDRAVQTLRLSAEEAKRVFGEYIPMDPQKGFDRTYAFTQCHPIGVVAAITPFNFPLNLIVHKVGPALAAGNAVVGKPASNTPLCAIKLFEYLQEALEANGGPDGLVNVVTGDGSTVGGAGLDTRTRWERPNHYLGRHGHRISSRAGCRWSVRQCRAGL